MRGKFGLHSTINTRSGSLITLLISFVNAPACNDNETRPSTGIDAASANTLGLRWAKVGSKRRKSAGTKSTSAPVSRRNLSAGPKNPLFRCTPGRAKMAYRSGSNALNTLRSVKRSGSVSLPRECRKAPGAPGPRGTAKVSIGRIAATADSIDDQFMMRR